MPSEIVDTLERLKRRMNRQRWLCATAAIAAVIVGGAIVLATIDYTLRISDPGLRWILTACWAAMAILAVYRFGIVPLQQQITSLHMARQVERHFPQFGDRLASALQFAQQREIDQLAGSVEMRRAVVVDTTADIEQLPPNAWKCVIDSTPLRRAVFSACAISGLAVVAFVASPSISQLAAARLAQPWRDLPWPRANQLEIVEAPSRIAKGQTFEATVADRRGLLPEDAQIHYRYSGESDRREESFPLQTVGDQLLARRENVQRSFAYRVIGGDDDTMSWRDVTVVDPPQLVSLDITAKPPAYTGLPEAKLDRHLRVLAGTSLAAVGLANEPLKSAAVEVVDGPTLTAKLSRDGEGSQFSIPIWPTNASLEKPESTYYRVSLENEDQIFGTSESWALRIDPDLPPTVEWKEPVSDQFVLAEAVVPLRVAVADNLAIKNAAILYRQGGEEDAEPQRVEIYHGPEVPPTQSAYEPQEIRDRRELEYAWDLSPLKLPPGSEISVIVEASDYKPGIGRTALPRRIRILTLDEFDSRLAERQTRIVRELEQALTQQRAAQQRTRQIELDTASKPMPTRGDIDLLASNSLDQRQIGRRLVDPEEGVLREIESLRNDLVNNRLDRPELTAEMQGVESELSRLAKSALPQADANLNTARKSAETLARAEEATSREALAKSLADAGQSQVEVASTLEKLVSQLQQWSDFQRFAREAARLQQEQGELRKATQAAAAQAAAASPQSRQAQAERQRIAEQQSELARRLDKLQLGMEEAVEKIDENGSASENISDALAQSREQGTSGKLREAARELQSDRLGRAAAVQQQAEEELQALLDTLRGRTARDPDQLAEQLRNAQEQLSKLREELAELDREAQQQSPEATRPKQESLAEQVARAARQMMRMGVQRAGQSTQQASQSLQQGDPQESDAQQQQANRDQADEQLAQAQQQLQQQIRQAEQQIAERKLDALAKQVADYIERQREVLTKTVQLEDAPQPIRVKELADSQSKLEGAARASAQEFAGQPVFEMALGHVIDNMQRAAEQLTDGNTGRATQLSEHAALTRLGHIADVLKVHQEEQRQEGEQNDNGQQGGQQGQGGQQQPPSPIDLAELKMLRFMQAELNQLTRNHEATLAERNARDSGDPKSAELSAEQQRLANLIDEMIRRLSQPPSPQN